MSSCPACTAGAARWQMRKYYRVTENNRNMFLAAIEDMLCGLLFPSCVITHLDAEIIQRKKCASFGTRTNPPKLTLRMKR